MRRILPFLIFLFPALVFSQTNNLPPDAQASESQKSAFAASPVSDDSLFFKDGKAMAGKAVLIKACAGGMNNSKKKKDIKINGEAACSCMFETLGRYYTYSEFMASFDKKNDLLDMVTKSNSPAYKDILNCVLSNMVTGSEKKDEPVKERTTKKEIASSSKDNRLLDNDLVKTYFLEACASEAKKSKDYKQSGIDADVYCQCTWDKIKEKGIALDKLADLQDPNSPLFNEIITPCVTMSMGGKETFSKAETPVKNSNDIVGNNSVERISLTRLMGIYKVKVKVGGIEKYFTLDSGANDVFINDDMERDLLMDGMIKKADYLPTRKYKMADGSYVDCRRLKLSGIQIGGYTVNNVVVAVGSDSNALLLLGKSLLDKFSSWSIDNNTEELVITR